MSKLTEFMQQKKKSLNLSYETIAIRSGLSDTSVKRIMDGQTSDPRINSLMGIAKAFNISFYTLLKECGYISDEEELENDF